MNFLISEARAETPAPGNGAAGAQPGASLMQFLPIAAVIVILYFLMIRPQQKRAKEHRVMLAALAKGDEVVTAGGTLGRVIDLNDNYVTVEIADGVNVKVQRHAVQTVLPKGTLKST